MLGWAKVREGSVTAFREMVTATMDARQKISRGSSRKIDSRGTLGNIYHGGYDMGKWVGSQKMKPTFEEGGKGISSIPRIGIERFEVFLVRVIKVEIEQT